MTWLHAPATRRKNRLLYSPGLLDMTSAGVAIPSLVIEVRTHKAEILERRRSPA